MARTSASTQTAAKAAPAKPPLPAAEADPALGLAEEEPAECAAPLSAPDSLAEALCQLRKRIAALKGEVAGLVTLSALVEKKATQALKKRTGANKGSARVKISEKIAAFLGVPADTVMTRSEVCGKVGDYTKREGCRPDGKRVVLNAPLADLIGGAESEEIPFIALVARLRSHMTPVPAPAPAQAQAGESDPAESA